MFTFPWLLDCTCPLFRLPNRMVPKIVFRASMAKLLESVLLSEQMSGQGLLFSL